MNVSGWLSRASPGFCAVTNPSPGHCRAGSQGTWIIDRRSQNESRGDWPAWRTIAASVCLARCQACQNCRFVSLKTNKRDAECSWYTTCNHGELRKDFDGWISGAAGATSPVPKHPARQMLLKRAMDATQCDAPDHNLHATTIPPSNRCSSLVYPARGLYALRLRQLHSCAAATRWSGALVADVPVGSVRKFMGRNATAADRQRALSASCLSVACIARRLNGGWTMLLGDSTQRSLFEELMFLLIAMGYACTNLGPIVGGRRMFDRDDRQKDYDCRCKRKRGSGPSSVHTLSFRFLRGLDHTKLRLNAADWSRRYLYAGWRSTLRKQHGTHLLLEPDSDDVQRKDRVFNRWMTVAERAQPTAVLYHQAAWLIPRSVQGGWAQFFYPERPELAKGTTLGKATLAEQAAERARRCAAVPENVTVPMVLRGKQTVEAPARVVRGSADACLLADDDGPPTADLGASQAAYTRARHGLDVAVRILRERYNGTLWLRSIFAGTMDAARTDGRQPQAEEMRRMDSVLRDVARSHCLGVLDVLEVDRAVGVYEQRGAEHFHSPPSAEKQAATAMLLWLRGIGQQR